MDWDEIKRAAKLNREARPIDIETFFLRTVWSEFTQDPRHHELLLPGRVCPHCGTSTIVNDEPDRYPGGRWNCPTCHCSARRFVEVRL